MSNPPEVTDPPAESRKSKRKQKPGLDPVAAAAKRSRIEKIARTVMVFLMPLMIDRKSVV